MLKAKMGKDDFKITQNRPDRKWVKGGFYGLFLMIFAGTPAAVHSPGYHCLQN